jgi:hypothetical protein
MNTVSNLVTMALQSGTFSEKGNFSGYNASGIRVHVSANAMKALGYDKANASTIAYPLYACVVEREFNVLNDNQEPTGETFKRVQAGSIFKTKAELLTAVNADKLLAVEAQSELQKVAKTLQLTDEVLAQLVNAPF